MKRQNGRKPQFLHRRNEVYTEHKGVSRNSFLGFVPKGPECFIHLTLPPPSPSPPTLLEDPLSLFFLPLLQQCPSLSSSSQTSVITSPLRGSKCKTALNFCRKKRRFTLFQLPVCLQKQNIESTFQKGNDFQFEACFNLSLLFFTHAHLF